MMTSAAKTAVLKFVQTKDSTQLEKDLLRSIKVFYMYMICLLSSVCSLSVCQQLFVL